MSEPNISPALSKQDAEELLFKYKESGDKKLLEELISHYRYIPELLSRRYSHRGAEFDDIYQVACIGLLNAINRFDTSKSIKFTTFATPTIIGEIKRYFRDKGYFIKVPRKIYETFNKANKIRAAFLGNGGSELSTKELADSVGVTESELTHALSWGDSQFVRSLEQFVYTDDNDKTFTDIIGVEDNHFLMIENKDFIKNFINQLGETEKKFVDLRYEQELSQSELAKILGISQMTVSRIEKKILTLLRQMYFDAIRV